MKDRAERECGKIVSRARVLLWPKIRNICGRKSNLLILFNRIVLKVTEANQSSTTLSGYYFGIIHKNQVVERDDSSTFHRHCITVHLNPLYSYKLWFNQNLVFSLFISVNNKLSSLTQSVVILEISMIKC